MSAQSGRTKTGMPSFLIGLNNLISYRTLDRFWAVEIQTTTECNRSCSICPNSKYPKAKHLMLTSTYKKILHDLSDMNFVGRISPHLYGEPLLDKRLPYLVELTRQSLPSTYICILTNGDLLSRSVFNELIQRGADDFLVTLHDNRIPAHLQELLASESDSSAKHIHVRVRNQLRLMNTDEQE